MFQFSFYQLGVGTCCFGPMCEGVNHTVFTSQIVTAVPLKIYISVGEFPIYTGHYKNK